MTNFLKLKTDNQIKLASGQFLLVERFSQDLISTIREFLVEPEVEVNYLLIVDKIINIETITRKWLIKDKAKVNLYYLFLQPLKTKIQLIHHIESQAILNSNSLILGKDQNSYQFEANYNFQANNSFGRIKVEACLREQSYLDYLVNLNIFKLAQKSDTRVDMRLYLEDNAGGKIIPSLNIAANNIKAGHSASTFKLTLEDLFYLRSRGLSLDEIKKIFILSLAKNFLQNFPKENLKNQVLDLILFNL